MLIGKERLITIPGFTIAAKEWGTPGGVPIIALHGWLDNAASFAFLAPLMPTSHIISIDSPGCGRSSFRAEGAITSVVDEIFYVLQIADQLGWQKLTLMGHSRGGAIAQLVAAGCPSRIEALIILDVVGFYVVPAEDAVLHLRKAVDGFFAKKRPPTLFENLGAAAKGRMANSTIAFESALALAERGTKNVEGGCVWSFDRRELLTSVVRYSEEQLTTVLSGIECPTCVVIADNGIMSDREMVKARASHIRNHELHFVPGHHHVHMDDAKVVAKPINEFTDKTIRKR